MQAAATLGNNWMNFELNFPIFLLLFMFILCIFESMIAKPFHFDCWIIFRLRVMMFFLKINKFSFKLIFPELVCNVIFLHSVKYVLIGFVAMQGWIFFHGDSLKLLVQSFDFFFKFLSFFLDSFAFLWGKYGLIPVFYGVIFFGFNLSIQVTAWAL